MSRIAHNSNGFKVRFGVERHHRGPCHMPRGNRTYDQAKENFSLRACDQHAGWGSPSLMLSGPHWEFAVAVLVIPTWSDPVNAAWPRTTWAEHLRKDTSGMEHWEAFYLALERDRWIELATIICSLDIKGSTDIYRQVDATFNIVHEWRPWP